MLLLLPPTHMRRLLEISLEFGACFFWGLAYFLFVKQVLKRPDITHKARLVSIAADYTKVQVKVIKCFPEWR